MPRAACLLSRQAAGAGPGSESSEREREGHGSDVFLPRVASFMPFRTRQSARLASGGENPPYHFRPQIGRDYPLNLSISLSGGKETNQDSLSNGE